MKKVLLTAFVVLSFSISVFAQKPIYLDENWQPTIKENMSFYREIIKQGSATLVKDFYKNGKLQMQGTAVDATLNNEIWDGEVTWYYANGKPQSTRHFKNGEAVGITKSYDEKGRVIEDFVYNEDGSFMGSSRTYYDPEVGNNSNVITEYKNGEMTYMKVYKNDINKLGYETFFKEYPISETKFYDEAGKVIGVKKMDKNYVTTGINIDYGYEDFFMRRIDRYNKKGEVDAYEIFYKSGKKAQEYKAKNKEAVKLTYDAAGKQIGKLVYKFNDELQYLREYNGEDISLAQNDDVIEGIIVYKNYEVQSNKIFDSTGKIKEFTAYENGDISAVTYYNADGSVEGKLIYQDGQPYDGESFNTNTYEKYKKGKLVSSKITRYDSEVLHYETSFDDKLQVYETKIYDEDSKLTYSYKRFDDDLYNFNAEIIQYKNGKQIAKATVNNSILVDGKISYKDYDGVTQMEVKDKWLITKKYNENNVMISESKELISLSSDEYYQPKSVIYEDFLKSTY